MKKKTTGWVATVETKWQPKKGLFKNGSASQIKRQALSAHGNNSGKAIQSLEFFIHRGGKGLSSLIKLKVEKAIKAIQKNSSQS